MTDYLCNLVVPGAGKSGTSSLCGVLSQHPEICMSRPKEPQFFSFDDRFERGPAFHNRIFGHCSAPARYYAEASQCYFADERAIERISRSLKRPKIVIMLRHPVDRAISQYNWNFRRGIEKDPIEKAVRDRGEERGYFYLKERSVHDAIGGYLAFSRYSRWVPLWQKAFGSDNVAVMKFEDFTADPSSTANVCFAFLGLPPITPRAERKNLTRKTFRTIAPLPLRLASKLVPAGVKNSSLYVSARSFVMDPLTPKPSRISQDVLRLLEDELADEIRYFKAVQ